jgi:hypothetical protein
MYKGISHIYDSYLAHFPRRNLTSICGVSLCDLFLPTRLTLERELCNGETRGIFAYKYKSDKGQLVPELVPENERSSKSGEAERLSIGTTTKIT